jgi:quercetin dioxygenase-like cupin family protein
LLTLFALAAAVAEPARLPDPLAAGWRGRAVCERLHEDDTQRVLRCSFPPGAGHERHFHVAHFGYALSGGRMRITDTAGTREVEVKTGSHFTSAGTPWHEALNTGDTTVAYLIVEPNP